MLKIRLTRKGKKNSAFFRVVVAEHTAPIKGKFLENLGFFNPHTKEKSFKADRIKYWIEKGAQCSDSVHNMLVSDGIVKGPKRAVRIKKKPVESVADEVKAGEEKKKEDAEAKTEPASPAVKEKEPEKPTEMKEEKKEEKTEEAKLEPEKDTGKNEGEEKE